MLADKISLENVFEVIEVDNTLNHDRQLITFEELIYGIEYENSNISRDDAIEINELLSESKIDKKVDITINLSKDPVLPAVWNQERLCNCLTSIATDDNRWKEDRINHRVSLWLPLGLTLVDAGNHSISTGVFKGEGEIVIGKDMSHDIYDISNLYKHMWFDGIYYYKKSDNQKICKAKNFDFGCLFEVGRVIYDKGYCFSDIKK